MKVTVVYFTLLLIAVFWIVVNETNATGIVPKNFQEERLTVLDMQDSIVCLNSRINHLQSIITVLQAEVNKSYIDKDAEYVFKRELTPYEAFFDQKTGLEFYPGKCNKAICRGSMRLPNQLSNEIEIPRDQFIRFQQGYSEYSFKVFQGDNNLLIYEVREL